MNNTARPPPTMPPVGPGAQPMQEPSTRERLARYRALARRGFGHWKVGLLIFLIGGGITLLVVTQFFHRSYLSEATLVPKMGIRTNDDRDDGSANDRALRIGNKLKDILATRSQLETAIKKFKLYPKMVESRGMLDAADEMKTHIKLRMQGGVFILSFESAEVDNANTPELVRDVTQYLAEELIEVYSNSSLESLRTSVNFFEQQAKQSEDEVERTTKALTVFLTKHPEFALTSQPGAQSQYGFAASGLKPPKGHPGAPERPQPRIDPALLAIYQADSTLRVLYLQRAKVEEDIKASQQLSAPAPAPTSSAAAAALQEQVALATAEVDAAQKRVVETQSDLMSKSSKLAPEHPDMKAAQVAAAAASTQLQQAKSKLQQLQAQRPSPGGVNPYDAPGANPELLTKLKEINGQIGQREAELKSKGAGAVPAPAPSSSDAPPASVQVEPVSPLVALETEWQRLLRDLSAAKTSLELRKKDYEKANMAVRAAQAASNEVMLVSEPAYKPTRAFKGKSPAAIAGFAIALVLAMLYMASRVALNDTIIDSADVEALQLIPVLGVVPKINVPPPTTSKETAAAARGGATGDV